MDKKDTNIDKVHRFISQLFKCIWLFFPGILFIVLPIVCFWVLGQGKDTIISFLNYGSDNNVHGFNYSRLIFFLATGFWVYESWYSSRTISYTKKRQEKNLIKDIAKVTERASDKIFETNPSYLEINNKFLNEFPRILGNSCFLVLELGVCQLPIIDHPLPISYAFLIFVVALVGFRYVNKEVNKYFSLSNVNYARITFWFWTLFSIFLVLVIMLCFSTVISIYTLFFLLLFLQIIFIYYSNLVDTQIRVTHPGRRKLTDQVHGNSFLSKLMKYFYIPAYERSTYRGFLILTLIALVVNFYDVSNLHFARVVGPFATIILSFAALLSFGNTVTAFSVRWKVNIHLILFLVALTLGTNKEIHYVKQVKLDHENNYDNRPGLETYLRHWVQERNVLSDTARNGYEIYFVMADGGASRSGYWTASVLSKIQDTLNYPSIKNTINDKSNFSDHIFCLSGTSGGGVGVASFLALLRGKTTEKDTIFTKSSQAFLKQDYFTYTFGRMLGPDFFNYIYHIDGFSDRADALEQSFISSSKNTPAGLFEIPLYDNFSNFTLFKNDSSINLPILLINTTRMQDGRPGVVSNLKIDDSIFNKRVDVVSLLPRDSDITLTSAAILGARFPYLSPAGRIADDYFVDGGYFDNSGSGVIQEIIRGIVNVGKEDSIRNGPKSLFYRQIKALHFKVLHITNSPVIIPPHSNKMVAPIKNDLFSPVLTIAGAYDMQTTVNNSRLTYFLSDINKYGINKAKYLEIALYRDTIEMKKDSLKQLVEPNYSMNWFMSDLTCNRMNRRLKDNSSLDSLISYMIIRRKRK